jgi:AcrR family transcriptional regulator
VSDLRAPPNRTSRKDLLLQAAIELLDELPPEEMTAAAVAQRAGVAHGLVFYYFGTKEGFDQAVAHRFYEHVNAAFASNAETDPGRAFTRDIEIFLDLVERHPGAMRATSTPSVSPTLSSDAISVNTASAERLVGYLGTPGSPLLLEVLRSWGLHAVDLALRWLDTPQITRADVQAILLEEVRAAVAVIAAREPDLGLDPDILS